jgi:hypothetical protein
VLQGDGFVFIWCMAWGVPACPMYFACLTA